MQAYITLVNLFVCLFWAQQPPPPVGQGLFIHEVARSHTTTHHSLQDSSGRVISSSQRSLPDNTQHSQQTDVHGPDGIRTRNPSKRAAADLRLGSRGHWDCCCREWQYYVQSEQSKIMQLNCVVLQLSGIVNFEACMAQFLYPPPSLVYLRSLLPHEGKSRISS